LIIDLTWVQLNDGSNLHLLLYYDDVTQWPAVYKNDSKVCTFHTHSLHSDSATTNSRCRRRCCCCCWWWGSGINDALI